MTLDQRVVVALALAGLPGVGRRRLRRLLQRLGDASVGSATGLAAWLAGDARGIPLHAPSEPACQSAWRAAVVLAETCARRGWHVWAIGGEDYPERLGRLTDPPAVLFVHGPRRWPGVPSIAIVGTREPTPWGEERAAACARAAARAGAVVVSGLAWGIDSAAHAAVVQVQGLAWATLPAGLDLIFPTSNRGLAAQIVECGGALVSEYAPGTRPHPTFFIERDRLQAALADVVLVIETGRSGGTQHTIRFARELGVPVWVTLPDGVTPRAGPGNQVRQEDRTGGDTLPVAQRGTSDLWQAGCPAVTEGDVRRWAVARRAGAELTTEPGAPPTQGRLFDAS